MVLTTNLKEYADHLQRQRLLQFLSGLNDSYVQGRRKIIIKSTEPTLNQAYDLIVENESQMSASGILSHTKLNLIAERNNITSLWSSAVKGGSMQKTKGITTYIVNIARGKDIVNKMLPAHWLSSRF